MSEINGDPAIYSKMASFFSAYQASLDQAAEYASPHHFKRVARKVQTSTVDSNAALIIGLSIVCGVCLCFALMGAMIYFFIRKGSQKSDPVVVQEAAPSPQIVIARV